MIKDVHKIHNMQEELKSDLIKCAVFNKGNVQMQDGIV